MKKSFQRYAARVLAVLLMFVLYQFARLPGLSRTERAALAEQFSFVGAPLPELRQATFKTVRQVHPSLQRISAWVSSTGAAVALNDLDGDGLPNDVCYVDPRSDQIVIAPVPGTPARYQPFTLTAPAAPLYDAATMAPMGCLPADLNEDGLLDILVYYWGRTPLAYLSQAEKTPTLGAGRYLPVEIVPGNERWYTGAATLADVDGDGHVDLIVGNYYRDGARILDAAAPGSEQMQHSMTRAANAGRARLFLWQSGAGETQAGVRFKDVSSAFDKEWAHGWSLAVAAADLDGDLLPEIYFANDFGPDRLLHNRSTPGQPRFAVLTGRKTLTTASSKVLGRDGFKGMGIDFGDLNGDGIPDMFVSNIAAEYALEESHFAFLSTGELGLLKNGIAPWVDRSEQLGLSRSGWGWESKLADFNNDGVLEALQATGFVKGAVNRWPELHELAMGNDELLSRPQSWPRFQPGDDLSGQQHNPFFVRAPNGRYYDLAPDLKLAEPRVSRGIATADVDGDGRLDFAVANQWDTSFFYHNESRQHAAFLGLHLLIPVTKTDTDKVSSTPGPPAAAWLARAAIGAKAIVHLPDQRQLTAQVDGGNGHSGKRSPDLHFGLGKISVAKSLQVELYWRDPRGKARRETLRLSPGWHTVMLGW
jgi:enediyne biosynthesis protein E4